MSTRPVLQRAARAFTLIELLVSIVVLSLLVIALFGILNTSASTWARSEDSAGDLREIRPALDLISRDLQSLASVENYDRIWINRPMTNTIGYGPQPANYTTLNTAFNNGVTVNGNFDSEHGDQIFFLTLQPKAAQDAAKGNSGLCTVGYYVAYTDDRLRQPTETASSVPSSYKLYRYFLSSDETLNRLAPAGSGTGFVPAKIVANPNLDEVVARRVVDFFITPYWRDASGNPTKTVPTTGNLARTPPIYVDVSFTIVGESAAKLLAARSAGLQAQSGDPKAPWHRQRRAKALPDGTYEFEYPTYADVATQNVLARSTKVITTRIQLERR